MCLFSQPPKYSLLLNLPAWDYQLSHKCDPPREVISETTAILLASSLSAGLKDTRTLSSLIAVKHDLIDHHLRWWLDRVCTRAGMILDIPEAQVTLFTDASGSGWAAHVNQFQASGEWSPREAILHINASESVAVPSSLTAYRTQLAGLTVQLMSDNATVVHVLPLETRRHSICEPLQSGEGGSFHISGIAHISPCQTYSRRQECVGRPALQERQSCSHGMDTSPVRGGHDTQHMGQAQCRPIRYTSQQHPTSICISHGRPSSSGCGRHVNHMEGNVCMRSPHL